MYSFRKVVCSLYLCLPLVDVIVVVKKMQVGGGGGGGGVPFLLFKVIFFAGFVLIH